jgi:hypothetical protein
MYQAAGPGLFTSGRPLTGRRYLIHLSGETLVSKTTSFQRLGTAGLAALAVVGLLSGCAAKKKTAATSSTGSTASAAAPAATSAAGAAAASATAALPSPSKVVATGGGKFCQQVAAEVNNSVAKEAASGTGVDSIKASVQEFQTIESSVLKSAPNAIKPDLVTLFGALDQFYGALAKANYDFTKIDPSVEAPLETPAVQKAEQNVDAYLKNTCGIDTGASQDSSAQAEASAAEASALAMLSAAAAPSS